MTAIAFVREFDLSGEEEDEFIRQYVQTMLWTEGPRTDENDDSNFLDAGFDEDDLSEELRIEIGTELRAFLSTYGDLIEECRHQKDWYTMGQAGHDFALTRNHHGAGFWDRGLGSAGDALTEASHHHGEAYFYLGDDGKIYG